jgi:hypothetical protein
MSISLLITSLPTQNTSTRMRVWRSLKASGAATLRDGVYILLLIIVVTSIANDVVSEQGTAYMFYAEPPLNLELAPIFSRKRVRNPL